jgi:acetoin utilization protein AcuC
MSNRRLAFVYAPEIERLSYPPDCPFKTQRPTQTRKQLLGFGLLGNDGKREVACEPVSADVLHRFHSTRYVEELQRAAAGELTVSGLHMGLGTPDTPVFPDLLEYGRWACGASLKAADLIIADEADIAFALLGGFHHAMAEKAAGFCYVNDVVLACERMATAGKRVLALDIDAHHGDGTQAAFFNRRDVLTMSFHESGKTLFPWGGFEEEIGEGDGRGFNVNVSLPAGTYDEAFLKAFERVAAPIIHTYAPDVIILELGMDALSGDPLTHLGLTNNAHIEVIERLLSTKLPILVVGGGGYHVQNTVRGWTLAWQACAGEIMDDFGLGMGGVMLETTEWAGGLRDRHLPVPDGVRARVEPELEQNVRTLERLVFPLHGIS